MIKQLLANGRDADLPERVRQAIRDQQEQSEMLIGWIQLSVVLTFGTLYLIAPKTFTDQSTFAPVPWALSIYLALTVIRIVWGRFGRLPAWSLAVSVVFDMALLMVLIWSFHLQYAQPASFYLKAPTLLYVFIFIALRALRFEARFVVLAGLVAALGWAGMIGYVITAEAGNTMITRDYVTYLTSNSILLGAEFDKIISILVVTAILAVALWRAKGLLVRAVAEQAAAADLSRFFDPTVADGITHAEHRVAAGEGVLREAAILNLDVRGFTGLAAHMPADALMGLLGQYQARMVPIIQRHGGNIDKFLGDGIMATFGAARDSDTAAADALRATDALMAEVRAWAEERRRAGKAPLEVNAAVATGRIVFGAVGGENRLEITVIGDAVNLSAKLEKHNKDEATRAIATAAAYDLALAQGYDPPADHERRAARHVIGVDTPIDLVVLER